MERDIGKISPCEPCFVACDRLGNALRLIMEDKRKQIIAAMDRNEITNAYAAAHPLKANGKLPPVLAMLIASPNDLSTQGGS